MLQITSHAETRMQQRGIREAIVASLIEYGREIHDHRGTTILYFDKRTRQALRRSVGHTVPPDLECHLDTYAIVGRDGAIVTVGHRTKRFNRF